MNIEISNDNVVHISARRSDARFERTVRENQERIKQASTPEELAERVAAHEQFLFEWNVAALMAEAA